MMTVNTRLMNQKERRSLRRKLMGYLLLLPVLLLFYALAYYFENLPQLFRLAAFAIPTIAFLMFAGLAYKQWKDLAHGEVRLLKGAVTDKVNYSTYSNTGKHSSKSKYIVMNNAKYYLGDKHFHQLHKGQIIELGIGFHSNTVLSINGR
ncbi:hypothetical protein [Nonlabens agnitus]|uniref:Uncharacterized protein n=1 Tax=Nonlabens agnitus TaxID=870484 RepID=A0A2S9WQU0_9FLAO|nr:hypothetical protein [Nonlabens agnitus]PRP65656.1 hypothetical protein BST86_00405 [Nonlabens agnitus]